MNIVEVTHINLKALCEKKIGDCKLENDLIVHANLISFKVSNLAKSKKLDSRKVNQLSI